MGVGVIFYLGIWKLADHIQKHVSGFIGFFYS